MHDCDEYGVLRWPLKDIAQAIGCKAVELKSIAHKEVLKGSDTHINVFSYIPRHAGKDGDPVILIPDQPGPLWYSSRMVRDEYIRSKRGEGTRFESPNGTPNPTPKHQPKPTIGDSPKVSPIQREGDGASSSSSVKSKEAADAADTTIWSLGVNYLVSTGVTEKNARTILGQHYKRDKEKLAGVVGTMVAVKPIEPIAYLQKSMQPDELKVAL